jgi:hypothetical protein
MATRRPQSDAAGGQGHLVVHHQQINRLASEPCHQVLDAFSAVVHESAGFGQYHLMPHDSALAQHGFGPPVVQSNLSFFGYEIDEPETYIVSGGGVSSARIPKANNEEHV